MCINGLRQFKWQIEQSLLCIKLHPNVYDIENSETVIEVEHVLKFKTC